MKTAECSKIEMIAQLGKTVGGYAVLAPGLAQGQVLSWEAASGACNDSPWCSAFQITPESTAFDADDDLNEVVRDSTQGPVSFYSYPAVTKASKGVKAKLFAKGVKGSEWMMPRAAWVSEAAEARSTGGLQTTGCGYNFEESLGGWHVPQGLMCSGAFAVQPVSQATCAQRGYNFDQDGIQLSVTGVSPVVHEVTNCTACSIAWCSDPARWEMVAPGVENNAITGSTVEAWGCGEVSTQTPIWRNDVTAVSWAVQKPRVVKFGVGLQLYPDSRAVFVQGATGPGGEALFGFPTLRLPDGDKLAAQSTVVQLSEPAHLYVLVQSATLPSWLPAADFEAEPSGEVLLMHPALTLTLTLT